MSKEAVFTMKLDSDLRDAFMADAVEVDRPASQIMRELMKDYLKKREEEKSGYNEFLRRKVERARKSIAAGKFYTNEEVQARMDARFKEWERKKREAET